MTSRRSGRGRDGRELFNSACKWFESQVVRTPFTYSVRHGADECSRDYRNHSLHTLTEFAWWSTRIYRLSGGVRPF